MNPAPDPVIEIFNEALNRSPSARADYLDRACASDSGLRERVELLLRAHGSAGGFLEDPVIFLQAGASPNPVIGERLGDRIGKYRLIQQIGEGGCGVVFLAEQENPVQRQVALKVVKPGMDTRSVIAQFESERQALAMMAHPHIAQVLDAGATEAGRPYFVMELVRGTKITDYCDEHALTIRARMELFMQVCHAIQHAHQKGVIHRDIKPSNILVSTTGEGTPLPKVIDFGIAKATTGQRLTDQTFFTAFELLIGTPTYMSPEQAALKSVDLDTRTDVYSLGVLLYELLTGGTPFDVRELLKVGLDEVRRDILNKEPVRPSLRLKTISAADLAAIGRRRRMDPSRLIRLVIGDLDWIVMKALEKDRARRYPTANALAMDVQHHLADEPVAARPPSTLYQVGKLVARNRLLVGSLGAIAVLLVGSLAIMSAMFAREQAAHRQAEAEKRTAQREAIKSQHVTKVLSDMLVSVSPSVAMGRDTTILREILDKTDKRITDSLGGQPEAEAELRHALGLGYRELGESESAERMLSRVAEIYRAASPRMDRELGTVLNSLVFIQLNQQKVEEAEPHVVFLQELWRKLGAEQEPEAIRSLETLAMLRWRQQKFGEAEEVMRRVYTWRRENMEAGHADTTTALGNLASILYDAKRLPEAEELFRQTLVARQRHHGSDHPALAIPNENLASVSSALGKPGDAKNYLARAVEIRRKFEEPHHPHRVRSTLRLADLNASTGDLAGAESLYREVIAGGRRDPDDYGPVLHVLRRLSSKLREWGRPDEADAVLSDILTPEYCGSPRCVPLLKLRADILARAGRWHEAAADAARLVALEPEEHEHYHTLAPLLVADGNTADYRKLCAEIIARFGRPTDIFVADRMAKDCLIQPQAVADLAPVALMANAVLRQGEGYDALPFFQVSKALSDYRLGKFSDAAALAKEVGDSIPHAEAGALAIQAMALHRAGQPDLAHSLLARGNSTFESKLPKLEGGDLGQDWRDWIIARELLSEARALLGNKPE